MNAKDFVRRPRGPALFDCHQHPVAIPSAYGDFILELHTQMDAPPTTAMIARAEELTERFRADEPYLCGLIYQSYSEICADPDWQDWLNDAGVECGKPPEEIGGYLTAKTLVVDENLLASAYMSPAWDQEHGLYFNLTPNGWVRGDC